MQRRLGRLPSEQMLRFEFVCVSRGLDPSLQMRVVDSMNMPLDPTILCLSLSSADVCYRRTSRNFAQCRPRHDHGGAVACVDDDRWLCPRWKDRVEDWGNCFAPATGRACQSPNFGCYKKRGVEFAQCRPLRPNCTEGDIAAGDWNTVPVLIRCRTPGLFDL